MSRVGKSPITKPSDVTVSISDETIKVSGPKGELSQNLMSGVSLEQKDDKIVVKISSPELAPGQGLMRSLINNMIIGVSKGFEKKLEVNGVGFKINLAGAQLRLSLGFSHEVIYDLPEGIEAKVDQNTITISGPDKQQVGQVAAEIRDLRKPEPYKGKGIKYADEVIQRKSGKSGKEGE